MMWLSFLAIVSCYLTISNYLIICLDYRSNILKSDHVGHVFLPCY